MNTSSSNQISQSYKTKMTKTFWRRLDVPRKLKGWYWLIPLLWLLLFLYGWFKIAEDMETQVENRVTENLNQSTVSLQRLSQESYDFHTVADGQNAVITASAREEERDLIAALAKSTTCDTWLADDVKCPIDIDVNLREIKKLVPKPKIVKTEIVKPKVVKFAHDFYLLKSSEGIELKGEVASNQIKTNIIQLAKRLGTVKSENIVVTKKHQKFNDNLAYKQTEIIGPLLKEGRVIWKDGIYSVVGITDKKNETIVRRSLQDNIPKNSIGNIDLKVITEVDRCGNAFSTALTRNTIKFATSSARISSESYAFLKQLSDLAKTCNMNISIQGHTDSVGSGEMNQKLSQARAQAVLNSMAENGVRPEKLSSIGLGETKPVATNETREGRQLNRRIEIKVSK